MQAKPQSPPSQWAGKASPSPLRRADLGIFFPQELFILDSAGVLAHITHLPHLIRIWSTWFCVMLELPGKELPWTLRLADQPKSLFHYYPCRMFQSWWEKGLGGFLLADPLLLWTQGGEGSASELFGAHLKCVPCDPILLSSLICQSSHL